MPLKFHKWVVENPWVLRLKKYANPEYRVENEFFFFVEKVNCVCYCVSFCSDNEEDDRDESESIDNVDILSSLLISPLFNQEVSFDWRKKRTFSRPPFQSEAKCESFDMKMIIFILMQIELIFTRRVLYLPSF